jgi:hypothetical protein
VRRPGAGRGPAAPRRAGALTAHGRMPRTGGPGGRVASTS